MNTAAAQESCRNWYDTLLVSAHALFFPFASLTDIYMYILGKVNILNRTFEQALLLADTIQMAFQIHADSG